MLFVTNLNLNNNMALNNNAFDKEFNAFNFIAQELNVSKVKRLLSGLPLLTNTLINSNNSNDYSMNIVIDITKYKTLTAKQLLTIVNEKQQSFVWSDQLTSEQKDLFWSDFFAYFDNKYGLLFGGLVITALTLIGGLIYWFFVKPSNSLPTNDVTPSYVFPIDKEMIDINPGLQVLDYYFSNRLQIQSFFESTQDIVECLSFVSHIPPQMIVERLNFLEECGLCENYCKTLSSACHAYWSVTNVGSTYEHIPYYRYPKWYPSNPKLHLTYLIVKILLNGNPQEVVNINRMCLDLIEDYYHRQYHWSIPEIFRDNFIGKKN